MFNPDQPIQSSEQDALNRIPFARSFAEAIVHELLHLKVPNHGKLFKNLMKAFLSDNSKSLISSPQ